MIQKIWACQFKPEFSNWGFPKWKSTDYE